jgi:hypothetical protein
MKVLNLSCESDHAFEGWFSSLTEFQRQGEHGLLRCPICDSQKVRRLPAAPRLNLGNPEHRLSSPAAKTKQLIDSINTMMASSEDVGERFAEEARRIHYLETKARNIRGIASAEEREALAEEGIEVFALPVKLPPKESIQ